MISFKSRACGRLWVGFSVKLGVRIHRRHFGSEAWNHAGIKECHILDLTRNRIKQSEWVMWHRLHLRKTDFGIGIVLRGRVDFGMAGRRNKEVEVGKIRADKLVQVYGGEYLIGRGWLPPLFFKD